MPRFAVKSAPRSTDAARLEFDEKSMWGGKDISPGDEVFLFAAEHNGGAGLYARGVVTAAARGAGSRVKLTVKKMSEARRRLGRSELRAFRDLEHGGPGAELDHKLYRQATNKIAGLSAAAADFLEGFF